MKHNASCHRLDQLDGDPTWDDTHFDAIPLLDMDILDVHSKPAPFLFILDEYGYFAQPALENLASQARSLGFATLIEPKKRQPAAKK